MYGFSHFGILQSVSAVNAFYFAKSLLAGICIAMLISLIWSQGAKIVLRVSGILFIGFFTFVPWPESDEEKCVIGALDLAEEAEAND